MKLEYYKSPEGIYVANQTKDYHNRRQVISSQDFLINGKKPQDTQDNSWSYIEGESEVNSLEIKGYATYENPRWERIDSTPEAISKLIPELITCEDACEYLDNGDFHIGEASKWDQYSMFFTRKLDRVEPSFNSQEFEVKFLGDVEVSQVIKPVRDYKVLNQSGKMQTLSLGDIASYDDLARMLTTDLLIHHRPCSISSHTTYKIVRKHVLDNIDPKWAVVTSNYDFCFKVKKKISVKPYEVKTEVKKSNGKSYAKPRISVRKVEHKEVELFEMTHDLKNYEDYTPIKGFKGDNLQDLVENIDCYLSTLMNYINSPLCQCGQCEGTGHILQENFKINNRI